MKKGLLILIFKRWPVITRDSLFQNFQRLHVPWNLGSELFSEWRHSCSHSYTHNTFVSASLRFLRWSIFEVTEELNPVYPARFPLRIPHLNPIKTRIPAPARYCNSRIPSPVFRSNPEYHGEEMSNPTSRHKTCWGPSSFCCYLSFRGHLYLI